MRVDTRVAAMLTTNHVHPWPEPNGNPCPTVSADRRVGDGSWGPTDNFNGYSTKAATANAGTDFACSGVAIFPPARGQYHQSNLVHVRYQRLGLPGREPARLRRDGSGPVLHPRDERPAVGGGSHPERREQGARSSEDQQQPRRPGRAASRSRAPSRTPNCSPRCSTSRRSSSWVRARRRSSTGAGSTG